MKKLIPVFALVLILSAGFTASASAQSDSTVFKPHWSFNGQIFADYYYMLSADTAPSGGKKFYYEPNSNTGGTTANTKNYQAFDMRRVQFGANYYYSKDITAKVLMEHESAYVGGDVLGDSKSGFYVKEASLTFGNWIPMANVIFGQQAMNLFSMDEGLMGYRGVEKSILDMRGMTETGSNDLGIQAQGNFDAGKDFGYSVALVNHNNSSKIENFRDKVIAGELYAKLLDKHIVIDVSGDDGGQPTATSGLDSGYSASNSLWKIAAAYTSKPITIGVVYANHTKGGQTAVKSDPGGDAVESGLSVFAHGQIIPKSLNAFARYDMFDPNTKANDNSSGRKESFIMAGLDWIPDADVQNVHVDPNIEINSFTDKSSAGVSYEPITVLRLTFWAKF
ncbi:MAG TPA: hypothetical protein VFH95_05630 [Candidatus Kapabacteria bacterium]|nr:hypothetical protein [Candidatus Kapabacteria bacterium]